jgi:transposase
VSRFDHTLEPKRELRRIEVITGAGGRRRWTAEEKARIVAETLEPGAVVSVIARHHGLSPQQLFGWRRAMRTPDVPIADVAPKFVPAVLEPDPGQRRRRRSSPGAAAIELEIAGVTVRIGDGARPRTIAAVIRALKGAP